MPMQGTSSCAAGPGITGRFPSAARQQARQAFEYALDLDPQLIDAMIGLGLILVKTLNDGWSEAIQEDEALAEKLLLTALERDANRPMARVAMGILRRFQNRLSDARSELEMAIALDGNNGDALRQLAITLLFLGEPESAIPFISKAIRLNPKDPNLWANYWPLGQCHLLLGHVAQAVDFLRKACAGNPRHYFLYLNLAGALGLKGDLAGARVALAEAMKLKPEVNSIARYRRHIPWATHPRH